MKRLASNIYRSIPFRQKALDLIRPHYHPPERIRYFLRIYGKFDVAVGDGSFKVHSDGERIESELYWKGYGNSWEAVSLNLWERLARNATSVFDVGAYTGLYSLAARTLNPTAEISAFEPLARNFVRLKRNIALNQFDIRANNVAVSDTNGTATFWDSNDVHAKSSSLEKAKLARNTIPVEVRVLRLDEYCRESGATPPDLLKIDVELHEPAVLKGMGNILTQNRPAILIEVLNDSVAEQIEALVAGLGYETYLVHEEKGVIPSTTIRPLRDGNFNVLLCTPETAARIAISDFVIR